MMKKEKIKRCQEILNKYNSCQKINDIDEFTFLISIFESHKEWDFKRGVGINSISVEKTTYGNKCFMINRIDGSKTDISFLKSITNPSDLYNIKRACRYAVRNVIKNFREVNVVFGQTKCIITGDILTKENTHIDHYDLKFNELFHIWIKNNDLNYLIKNINKSKDNSIDTYFIDKSINDDFICFHNNNTHLRAVTAKANLTILK